MTEEKKLKIEFAPGCFDSFDGTQEELDAFMAELQNKLSSMTREQIEAESRTIDEEYLEEMFEKDPEYAAKLVNALLSNPTEDRKLQ
jgi:flagellar biosynthesis/type III secretory pathway M-ring protein FliF/YscJ